MDAPTDDLVYVYDTDEEMGRTTPVDWLFDDDDDIAIPATTTPNDSDFAMPKTKPGGKTRDKKVTKKTVKTNDTKSQPVSQRKQGQKGSTSLGHSSFTCDWLSPECQSSVSYTHLTLPTKA